MGRYPTATIVNFCTNEKNFIKPCLEEALKFSRQVIVPVCDHFFDGTKEDIKLLQEIAEAFPKCLFIEYPFLPQKVSNLHNLSRFVAWQFIEKEVEKVLFLDADEIVDGAQMGEWLKTSPDTDYPLIKFANYWYFRSPTNQADTWEDSAVIVNKKSLKERDLLQEEERDAIYNLSFEKKRMVVGSSGEPMIHHYSWVRSKEQMLKKVHSWGHREDREWGELVEKEFAGPVSQKDFIHGYTYKKVDLPFEILDAPQFVKKGQGNYVRLKPPEVLKAIKRASNPFWSLIFRRSS